MMFSKIVEKYYFHPVFCEIEFRNLPFNRMMAKIGRTLESMIERFNSEDQCLSECLSTKTDCLFIGQL